jgi:hypothetical protein
MSSILLLKTGQNYVGKECCLLVFAMLQHVLPQLKVVESGSEIFVLTRVIKHGCYWLSNRFTLSSVKSLLFSSIRFEVLMIVTMKNIVFWDMM